MKKNNLLNIFWFSTKNIGGVETHLSDLLYKNKRYNSTLLHGQKSFSTDREPYFDLLDMDQSYTQVEMGKMISRFTQFFDWADVIDIHNPLVFDTNKTLFLLDFIKKYYSSKKLVITIHNLPKQLTEVARFEEYLKDSACKTVSKYLSSVLEEIFSVKFGRLYYSFDTCDIDTQHRTTLGQEVSILQPTRFCNWKGSHLSLKSVVNLLDSGFKIKFSHAGLVMQELEKNWDVRWKHIYPDLKEKVNYYHSKNCIDFIKYSPSETYSVFSKFDIVLHPSTGEGINGDPFPISVQQSMLLGKPMVVSDSGGIQEIVEGCSFVSVIKANDQGALEAALKAKILTLPVNLSASDITRINNLKTRVEHAKNVEF